MSQPSEDCTSRLEIHASGQINVILLPKRQECIIGHSFRGDFDVG